MSPQLNLSTYSVSARCPTCHAITSFEQKSFAHVEDYHSFNINRFSRTLYVFSQCAGCRRGGLATIHDNGSRESAVLESFFPLTVDTLSLPNNVPPEICAEFREAELCAALGANRAASALFRSVLEKVLRANGYTTDRDPTLRDLQKRIDAAATDGIITDSRRRRAHEDVRSLGNDVLHDDWRQIIDEEVEASRRYTQRILEDFYDDRDTVKAILIDKQRITASPEQT